MRQQNGARIELLFWDYHFRGHYKSNSKSRIAAHSQIMICKVTFIREMQHIGTAVAVMVVHMHNQFANLNVHGRAKDSSPKIDTVLAFFDILRAWILKYDVRIMMGDFNMALLLVIPALRRGGLCIDLASWFPWKASPSGRLRLDSCGIFFIDTPGRYILHKGLSHFHGNTF